MFGGQPNAMGNMGNTGATNQQSPDDFFSQLAKGGSNQPNNNLFN